MNSLENFADNSPGSFAKRWFVESFAKSCFAESGCFDGSSAESSDDRPAGSLADSSAESFPGSCAEAKFHSTLLALKPLFFQSNVENQNNDLDK